MNTLRELSKALSNGETSSSRLVSNALTKARQSESVFITLNEELVTIAESIDRSRQKNEALPALAGIPITLKDLFNVQHQRTLAGSVVLKNLAKPEEKDAEVLAPLRDAGLLFLGRTNMSEFAFSGMGVNPHYGTPRSIWDRETGRLPGGSSSGSAVSVAEGIVVATLGSDTAGSCRIPAAFNGIVGVKPSCGRFSLNGIYPLSPTSDAPGPLANDVDSCYLLDQLMYKKLAPQGTLPEIPLRDAGSLKLAIPESRVMDDLDDEVQSAFDSAIDRLGNAGVDIQVVKISAIDQSMDLFFNQAIVMYEAYQHQRELLEKYGEQFDPFVRDRTLRGSEINEDEQQDRYRAKAIVIELFNQQFKQLEIDALLYPTTPCIPPEIAETDDPKNAAKINLRCLRNTATANYFDGCSINLPCHRDGEAPVGLMVSAMNGDDEKLYSACSTIEKILQEANY